ncbi:MAG: cell division protein FtsQ/DivIB [Parvularcula sp.]
MPPVKKRGKSGPKKKSPTKRGGARRKSSKSHPLSEFISRFWSGLATYTVVGLCVIAIAAFVMLAAGGYLSNVGARVEALTSSVAKSAGFVVGRVSAKGQDDISDREIMEALRDKVHGDILGRSLLNLDAQKLRAQIESLPRVRSAAVQKLWPDTVHITIIEREPIAMWQDSDLVFHLVDREGTILDIADDADQSGLFVISGTTDPESAIPVLTSLAKFPDLYSRVASIVSVNDRRFDLRFRNDFTAKLPEENIDAALARLDGLGAGTGRLAETLKYLDLRNPRWAYFQPKSS